MRAEKVIQTLLHENAALVELIGRRVYGLIAKDADPPLVIYALESATREYELDVGQQVVVTARIVVRCVATTYPGLKALAELVRIALDEQGTDNGAESNPVIAGVELVGIQLTDERADDFDLEWDWYSQERVFEVKVIEPAPGKASGV